MHAFFTLSLFRHFLASLFNFLNNFVWLMITDEDLVTEMRTWSIPIKNGVYILVQVSFYIFILHVLGECHCLWTREFPRAHVAKFYGQRRLIRSVLRASIFSVLNFIEIMIMCVYYTIPFWLWACFCTFGHHFSTFKNYFVWLRIIDESSVTEMRIWYISLIKSDWKWCIHLSASLFLYFKVIELTKRQWVGREF